ncbi:transposase%2C Mutator family protein [Mycobacteroides abscessus]|nr:transposase%2C Mutator family protein [Mycobacteroides abscessus]CPX14524.1 transposase%2C Mutator family protein [Mycobacteroides abscessus]
MSLPVSVPARRAHLQAVTHTNPPSSFSDRHTGADQFREMFSLRNLRNRAWFAVAHHNLQHRNGVLQQSLDSAPSLQGHSQSVVDKWFGVRTSRVRVRAEMSHHLGYDKHDPLGRNRSNSRNGTTSKTVTTDIGKVSAVVPRGLTLLFCS